MMPFFVKSVAIYWRSAKRARIRFCFLFFGANIVPVCGQRLEKSQCLCLRQSQCLFGRDGAPNVRESSRPAPFSAILSALPLFAIAHPAARVAHYYFATRAVVENSKTHTSIFISIRSTMKLLFPLSALSMLILAAVADAGSASDLSKATLVGGVSGQEPTKQVNEEASLNNRRRKLSDSDDEEEESSDSSDSAEEEEENEKEMAYTAYGAVGSAAVILSGLGLLEWQRQRRVKKQEDEGSLSYHLNKDDNGGVQVV